MQKIITEKSDAIEDLKERLLNEKKTNELNEREISLQKRIVELKDLEIKFLKDSFDRMKDIADRAIKLSGDKPIFDKVMEWVIRIAIFIAAYVLAK